MSILVVEDSAVTALLLQNILEQGGYATTVVPDGLDALRVLESDPTVELLIADIMMPGMDGIELLRQMNARTDWQHVPVVVCSSLAGLDVMQEATRLGARDYVVKPIQDPARVLEKVRELLDAEPPVLEDEAPARERLHVDPDVYRALLESLVEHVEAALAALDAADAPGWKPAPAAYEDLLGLAAALGARKLRRILERLDTPEELTRDPLPGIPAPPEAVLPLLRRELAAVRAGGRARLGLEASTP